MDGDSGAIETLFRRFYPRVERMVHRDLSRDMRRDRPWLIGRFSTGDVVQEVFRKLLQNLEGFEGKTEDAFCGYLAMVVRNRLVDAIRFHEAAQRDGRRTASLPEGSDVPSGHGGPAAEAAIAESASAFQETLAQFPEREQLLLRERLERDTKFRELADRLGYPSKWAARRAFYAAQARLVILLRQRQNGGEGQRT